MDFGEACRRLPEVASKIGQQAPAGSCGRDEVYPVGNARPGGRFSRYGHFVKARGLAGRGQVMEMKRFNEVSERIGISRH